MRCQVDQEGQAMTNKQVLQQVVTVLNDPYLSNTLDDHVKNRDGWATTEMIVYRFKLPGDDNHLYCRSDHEAYAQSKLQVAELAIGGNIEWCLRPSPITGDMGKLIPWYRVPNWEDVCANGAVLR